MCYQQWLFAESKVQPVSADAENVVRSLRTYVDQHLDEDFGLKSLSARAGYAPSYLSGIFSRVNGQGLTEYISRKRIALAQELLRDSKLKIVAICYRVGFRDLAHFNRTFKRFVGTTPNQYRQSDVPQPPLDATPAYSVLESQQGLIAVERASAMIA
jgi:AraC-like DNA-binding protein